MTTPQTAEQINRPQTGSVEVPTAAETVLNGKTEREAALEREIEEREKKIAERDARLKKVETDLSHAEDEMHRLKAVTTPGKKPRDRWLLLQQED